MILSKILLGSKPECYLVKDISTKMPIFIHSILVWMLENDNFFCCKILNEVFPGVLLEGRDCPHMAHTLFYCFVQCYRLVSSCDQHHHFSKTGCHFIRVKNMMDHDEYCTVFSILGLVMNQFYFFQISIPSIHDSSYTHSQSLFGHSIDITTKESSIGQNSVLSQGFNSCPVQQLKFIKELQGVPNKRD